ncbi:hypothetical protein [Thermocatellispora tengchongensis]
MSAGLARRLAALGVGVAMAAAATGLIASPAAAATAGTAAAPKPKVTASTPSASPKNHEGECPVTVTFSSKIAVTLKGGKTQVAYRWLHGDGSKSKVKSFTLKGKGTKVVTVKERSTFKSDVKGWQALQVLAPYKKTTKKGYFSVSCKDTEIKVPKYAHARVDVDPSHYSGACTPWTKITAVGTIRVSGPTWVKYRWVHNGRVVDYGKAKVYDGKRVYYTFKPRESHRGWVALDIVSPSYGDGDRAGYKVYCKDDAKASASVNAPSDYEGACPVARTFGGTISASGRTEVKYRWAGPGYTGPVESLYFRHGGSKGVSHTVNASDSGEIKRWIEILGPNRATSNTGVTKVTCKAPVTATVESLLAVGDNSTCAEGKGPSVKYQATVKVTGPTTLVYHWEVNGKAFNDIEKKVDAAGTVSLAFGSGPSDKSPTTGTAKLVVTSPNSSSASTSFSLPCPTA